MTSPIGGIFSIPSFPTVPAIGEASAIGQTSVVYEPPSVSAAENGFADVLTGAIENVQGTQANADALAVQAATGDLKDVHDYMIAAQEASLTTEMFVTLKNKAVEAFTEIMRMPI
jgi:flagellar hook-basal body complex protein FliE